ncbi:MAG: hypothetical protein AB1646_16155 [Thermodesulfobacteriota bacterium]
MGKIGAACLTILLACLVAGSMAHAYVVTMGEVTAFSMGHGMCGPMMAGPGMCGPAMMCPPPACYPQAMPMAMPCPPPPCYKPITKVKRARVAPTAMAAPVCGPMGCYPAHGGHGMMMPNPHARWH